MSKKEKILESWIMVEHLSEGDINKNDKSLFGFEDLNGNDYYTLFQAKMKAKKVDKKKNGGIVIYFDIFEFKEVVELLREKYHLAPTEEEIKFGSKFAMALYFDKSLNFLEDMTFLTESGYIRCFEEVPKEETFHEYETEMKTKIAQFFEESAESPEKFNQAMERVLSLQTPQIDINQCKLQPIENIELDATNLHSFFIEDLEAAKTITTPNLDKYLLGNVTTRINLDSKSDSINFNAASFEEILQPENYPLGRFPSNAKYALSFMQQVAVNLSIGYDNSQIRSVNGPPGTGKTTLLKDIFAELVVKQAHDICNLSKKCIKGTPETQYYEKATIGVIPEHIAENGIVVASSNNGAVQNIVNELPLDEKIDAQLIDELKKADYFQKIANLSEEEEDKKDGEQEAEPTWGLFSLEGGKSKNMTNIITNLKSVVSYLEDEYEEEEEIYDEFEKQYKEVEVLRQKAQNFANEYHNSFRDRKELRMLEESYEKEMADKEKALEDAVVRKEEIARRCHEEIERLERCKREKEKEAAINEQNKQDVQESLKLLQNVKTSKFDKIFRKNPQNDNLSEEQTKLREFTQKSIKYRNQINEYEKQIAEKQMELMREETSLEQRKQQLKNWREKNCAKIAELRNRIEVMDKTTSGNGIKPLQMDLTYDELQLSNPWFDEEYRVAQSKLFITALRVRKQFLYENRKNVKAATNIWNNQNEYVEKKIVVSAAWDWINMTVPVISSTFASFGRMCKNLNENTLGHLFIDEAGQALPQAAVGAIFRSRHVMVVGDPAQIKPVLTLDANVLKMLGKHFDVSEKYLSESASTQTLTDAVSQYGYYRDKEKSDDSWIGIPLWVHRRCQYPMFTISNCISYDGLMVQGKPGYGKTGWYDVKGKANNKYVEEQGEFLLKLIEKMAEENPDILDKEKKDIIYVISPFSNVAFRLSQKLKSIGFTRYANGKPTNIGTVHTFQGKEAPIVFMVLGADEQSSGAARWAVSEPNMMNVAATRAKEEFYIIGNKKLYLSLGCDVATETNKVIKKYAKEYPDKVLEQTELQEVEQEEIKYSDNNEASEGMETTQKSDVVEEEIKEESTKEESLEKEFTEEDVVEEEELEEEEESEEEEVMEKESTKTVMYIGNSEKMYFHELDCKYAPRMPQKRVELYSKEEAIKAGYQACKVCNP